MDITEVRVFLKNASDRKLKAYASVTFDNCFVVRNVKIIEGLKGFFVAMPSRKAKEHCQKCGYRNVLRSKYCNDCGSALEVKPHPITDDARRLEYKDIAHPITLECRENIQKKVLEAFESEMIKGVSPSNMLTDDDDDE